MRTSRNAVIFAIVISTVGCGGCATMLRRVETSMVFFPAFDIYRTPANVGWEFEDVTLEVGREKTRGWYIPSSDEPQGVVLFSHGNAGNISGRLDTASVYREMGYDVFLYDYGGYGESTGRPSEERCYEDIRAAWNYLREVRDIAPDEIILHGRSLGGGPTCELARVVEPAGIIIESTFTSVPDMAEHMYPIIPTGLLVAIEFDNASKVADLKAPVLVVHGPGDSLIPFSHGKELFELAPEPKSFLEISGDHNDGYGSSNKTYVKGIGKFLEELEGISGD